MVWPLEATKGLWSSRVYLTSSKVRSLELSRYLVSPQRIGSQYGTVNSRSAMIKEKCRKSLEAWLVCEYRGRFVVLDPEISWLGPRSSNTLSPRSSRSDRVVCKGSALTHIPFAPTDQPTRAHMTARSDRSHRSRNGSFCFIKFFFTCDPCRPHFFIR